VESSPHFNVGLLFLLNEVAFSPRAHFEIGLPSDLHPWRSRHAATSG